MQTKNYEIQKFRELMSKKTHVEANSDLFFLFHKFSQNALKITNELNNKYHTPDEIRKLFAKLTQNEIPENTIAVGNPARVIKYIDSTEGYN